MRSLPVSVIVPVYQGGEKFRQCLTHLTQTQPPPAEIIVVVDGDDRESALIANQFAVRTVSLPTNRGPAYARNRGAALAQHEILFFIDADIAVPPAIIDQVYTMFTQHAEVAALIGSYDDEPDEPNFISQYKNLFHHYVHQCSNETATTFWGACGGIRRSIFQAVGGFDETYPQPSIEDIELGHRLIQAGHQIRLCKQIQVKHLKHWSAASMVKTDFFKRALPWVELILIQKNLPNDLNLRYSHRFSVVLIFLWVGVFMLLPVIPWVAGLLLVVISVILFGLNLPVYRFFWQRRGLFFALSVIPWHWFYYFYSGVAFLVGLGRHIILREQLPS